jgi:hypothetical protein
MIPPTTKSMNVRSINFGAKETLNSGLGFFQGENTDGKDIEALIGDTEENATLIYGQLDSIGDEDLERDHT